MNDSPIGVLDSGIGGLSVWPEIAELMPHESVVYFADSANCPYGTKTKEEIERLCEQTVDFLLGKGCKIIIVACNTATSMAIRHLRGKYNVPFIGIEPAVKPAALHSKTGVIGVLATAGTLHSRLFNETKNRFTGNVDILSAEGTGLVELVEEGKTGTPEAEALLRKYIEPMMGEDIDYLVLGCTHYPFLAADILKITGNKVTLIDPAPAVAARAQHMLREQGLECKPGNPPYYAFYSSAQTDVMQQTVISVIKNKGLKIEPDMCEFAGNQTI